MVKKKAAKTQDFEIGSGTICSNKQFGQLFDNLAFCVY